MEQAEQVAFYCCMYFLVIYVVAGYFGYKTLKSHGAI